MAMAEDAATVLEQFVHDVANLPAEIAHLLEEIQAKDQSIQECRTAIHQRDNVIQKHVKASGCKMPHPKEEQFTKSIQANFEKAQRLQEEKCSLANKASLLLDRHVRRLDVKIRDLQTEGAMNLDPQIPSLIQSSDGNLVPPVSASNTGTNTPLNPIAFNVGGGSASIANAAMARMLNNAALSHNRNAPNVPPVPGMHPHSLLNSSAPDRKREMSASAVSDSKRRRLNANLGTLPNPSSGLRQTSLGPGTPKAQTPGSRAGSAGPRTKKFASKKIAPHQQSKMSKKVGKGGIPKKSARRLMGGVKASPSTTDNESQLSDASGSEEDASTHGNDGAADDDEVEDTGYDDDGDDNALYCWCRTVSHGDMVACDNEKCKYEWFHWNCVGLTEEPRGRWLCPDCEKLDKSKIKLAR